MTHTEALTVAQVNTVFLKASAGSVKLQEGSGLEQFACRPHDLSRLGKQCTHLTPTSPLAGRMMCSVSESQTFSPHGINEPKELPICMCW